MATKVAKDVIRAIRCTSWRVCFFIPQHDHRRMQIRVPSSAATKTPLIAIWALAEQLQISPKEEMKKRGYTTGNKKLLKRPTMPIRMTRYPKKRQTIGKSNSTRGRLLDSLLEASIGSGSSSIGTMWEGWYSLLEALIGGE